MSDPSNPVTRDEEGVAHMPAALVGVYADEQAVIDLRDRVVGAGVPEERVRIGDRDDESVALLAEQQEETSEGWILPQVGVAYPKEATKGGLALGIPITLGVTLLCLAFAFIPIGDLGLGVRLLIWGFVGLFAGGAIALIAPPALSSPRPDERNAAHRGVTIRVDDASPEVEQLMRSAEPIRLDRVHGAAPIPLGTVETEGDRGDDGIFEQIKANTDHPLREDLAGEPKPVQSVEHDRDRSG